MFAIFFQCIMLYEFLSNFARFCPNFVRTCEFCRNFARIRRNLPQFKIPAHPGRTRTHPESVPVPPKSASILANRPSFSARSCALSLPPAAQPRDQGDRVVLLVDAVRCALPVGRVFDPAPDAFARKTHARYFRGPTNDHRVEDCRPPGLQIRI